jgi:surfactin synthase thioesterase subunit
MLFFILYCSAVPVPEAFVRHALPLIRRDYQAFETYDVIDQKVEDTVPILAIYPLGDQVVTNEQCIDWSEYTTDFSYATTAVDGHFYLTTPHGLKELVNLIVNKVFEHMPAAK